MTCRISVFTKYDRAAASTRQRILQFVPALNAAGIDVDCRALLSSEYVTSLGSGSQFPRRKIARGYMQRFQEVGFEPLGDIVWVYGELFPRLPALLDKLLVRRGLPIVCDFDDAFFHTYDQHPNRFIKTMFARKFEPLLRSAAACTCGNAYLRDYAAQFCSNALIVPTVVDMDVYRPAARANRRIPIIGWIGSPSTSRYLLPIFPCLQQFVEDGLAEVRVVGAGSEFSRSADWIQFVDWSEKEEVAELQRMDIGIMPLPDEPWTRGKCGYKLIQYLACGVPVVASPVGVNSDIVSNGVNGFLASSISEWRRALLELLTNSGLRKSMGEAGPSTVRAHYSLASQAPRVVDLFKSLADRPDAQSSARA